MSTAEKGLYPPYAHARVLTLGSIVFQGANGADPTAANTEDPGKMINAVTRTAEGVYNVPLKRRYAMVHAVSGHSSDADDHVSVTTVTDGGGAANSIVVTCQTGAGTNDDLDAKNITVVFLCYGSTS